MHLLVGVGDDSPLAHKVNVIKNKAVELISLVHKFQPSLHYNI